MTVEKIIRILGYIVYTILWLPVIVLALIILPMVYIVIFKSIKEGLYVFAKAIKHNINHDMEFIKTGIWY